MFQTAATPPDSTLLGLGGSSTSLTAVTDKLRTYIIKSGFIRSVNIQGWSATVIGTNEDWTFSVYDGTTTTAIATVGAATQMRVWRNNNMNYPVTEGGYVLFTTTTPAWVTNPEGISFIVQFIVESE